MIKSFTNGLQRLLSKVKINQVIIAKPMDRFIVQAHDHFAPAIVRDVNKSA